MASVVEICNRALQKLGAQRITALTENSKNARACLTCYEALRDAELRKHRWSFSIKRFQLAASATAPLFGRQTAYPLPAGALKLLDPDPNWNFSGDYASSNTGNNNSALDFIIEGTEILSDQAAPLNVRLVMKQDDPNKMDPLFREALAAKMALEMCEEITQSNTKKESLREDYKTAIADAKKANGIEVPPQMPPIDSWLTARF